MLNGQGDYNTCYESQEAWSQSQEVMAQDVSKGRYVGTRGRQWKDSRFSFEKIWDVMSHLYHHTVRYQSKHQEPDEGKGGGIAARQSKS